MSWLEKVLPKISRSNGETAKKDIPAGVWTKCSNCGTTLYAQELRDNLNVCPKCNHHAMPAVVAVFEFGFMAGSMGSVVGERFARAVQAAIDNQAAFVCFTASGGARMQEGLFSLMQMAKTTGVIAKLAEHKLPFISVLTDPTMGGVSASFAFMGDVVMAEPKALIGFAGPRVIEQTVREQLPEGFQRSEFLLQKGAIDMIVDRKNLKMEIAKLIALFQKESLDAIE